jgi:hypothetical protein
MSESKTKKRGGLHPGPATSILTDAFVAWRVTFEKPLNQWNEMKIVCVDDEIKVLINGAVANHGTRSSVNEGAIALQSEGTSVEFRNIRIQPLKK